MPLGETTKPMRAVQGTTAVWYFMKQLTVNPQITNMETFLPVLYSGLITRMLPLQNHYTLYENYVGQYPLSKAYLLYTFCIMNRPLLQIF